MEGRVIGGGGGNSDSEAYVNGINTRLLGYT